MVNHDPLKRFEIFGVGVKDWSTGLSRGDSCIADLQFMDLRDNASRFQYSQKLPDVFELSVVSQYKPMVLKIRYPPTLKKLARNQALVLRIFFQTSKISFMGGLLPMTVVRGGCPDMQSIEQARIRLVL